MPKVAKTSGSYRPVESSIIAWLLASVRSVETSPVSRSTIQSLAESTHRTRAYSAGAWSRSQRSWGIDWPAQGWCRVAA